MGKQLHRTFKWCCSCRGRNWASTIVNDPYANSKGWDQTAWIRSLIWAFPVCTCRLWTLIDCEVRGDSLGQNAPLNMCILGCICNNGFLYLCCSMLRHILIMLYGKLSVILKYCFNDFLNNFLKVTSTNICFPELQHAGTWGWRLHWLVNLLFYIDWLNCFFTYNGFT